MSNKESATKGTVWALRLVAIAASVTAAGLVTWFAYAMGQVSVAKGMVIGASATLVVIVVLWLLGSRAGAPGRLATGEADERERKILTEATADGAFAMILAGVVAMLGAILGWPAVAVAGLVLWVGVIAIAASFAIRLRRS